MTGRKMTEFGKDWRDLDDETFIARWQAASNVGEVASQYPEIIEKYGFAKAKMAMSAKALRFRQAGIEIKTFPRGIKKVEIEQPQQEEKEVA